MGNQSAEDLSMGGVTTIRSILDRDLLARHGSWDRHQYSNKKSDRFDKVGKGARKSQEYNKQEHLPFLNWAYRPSTVW